MLEGWSPTYCPHVMVIKDGRTLRRQGLVKGDWDIMAFVKRLMIMWQELVKNITLMRIDCCKRARLAPLFNFLLLPFSLLLSLGYCYHPVPSPSCNADTHISH